VDTQVYTNAVGYALPAGRYVVVPFLFDATKVEDDATTEDDGGKDAINVDEDNAVDTDDTEAAGNTGEIKVEQEEEVEVSDNPKAPVTEGSFCLRILVQKPL